MVGGGALQMSATVSGGSRTKKREERFGGFGNATRNSSANLLQQQSSGMAARSSASAIRARGGSVNVSRGGGSLLGHGREAEVQGALFKGAQGMESTPYPMRSGGGRTPAQGQSPNMYSTMRGWGDPDMQGLHGSNRGCGLGCQPVEGEKVLGRTGERGRERKVSGPRQRDGPRRRASWAGEQHSATGPRLGRKREEGC